jgi:putative spermidine/putrescine transport system ATP-binding protein
MAMPAPHLTLDNLTKTYGAVTVVDGVSLDVAQGEFLSLLGPSGCGTTTTLRMIAGFVAPTAGTIALAGQSIAALPPYRRGMGVVFQNYALFPHLNVFDNIVFGLQMARVAKTEATKRVARALALVRLEGFGRRRIRELSCGQQQRVALARALVIEPTVLLLDEPLSNLDAKLREELRHEIREIQRELGITSLFVTHDQVEALTMSDRIAVLNAGRIEQIGTPEDVYERPASRFVAEFIGRMNFFSRESSLLAIRPERARLMPEKPANGFFTRGTVRQVLYLGATLEYHLALDSGERALVETPNDGHAPRFAAGDAVWFTAPEENCLEMPAR